MLEMRPKTADLTRILLTGATYVVHIPTNATEQGRS
jgi:hypothetical protein